MIYHAIKKIIQIKKIKVQTIIKIKVQTVHPMILKVVRRLA